MLKQAHAILQHRALVVVGILLLLMAGMRQSLRHDTDIGGALLDFEAAVALAGAYIGFSLQRLLRTYHSQLVPGYVRKHLVIAFASQILAVLLCVAGAASFTTNHVVMFAVLWGWSLAWCCAGYLGKISLILAFWLHVLLMALLYVRSREFFLALIQRRFVPSDLIFLMVDLIAVVLMVFWMSRRPSRKRLSSPWARKTMRKTSEALEGIYFPQQRPWSKIRQLGLSLKPDYWPFSLLMIATVLLWGRYRGAGALRLHNSEFGAIYTWCFLGCYFMLGEGAFTRDRVRSLFQLPFNRRNLIRDYGMTVFLSCARRWCAFMLVACVSFQVPLPGVEPLKPPAEVWIYCAGILLIVFGLRALMAPANDRLLLRILVVLPIVLYASFSDLIPMSPVLAVFIGLGLIVASYYRWCKVEMG